MFTIFVVIVAALFTAPRTVADTKIEQKLLRPFDTTNFNSSWVSSRFGWRELDMGGATRKEFHNGTDYRLGIGTRVLASGDGVAYYCGWQSGYGWIIKIRHGSIGGKSVETWVAHLSKQWILEGQQVKQGQLIGETGNTGYSEGPHLHFMCLEDGVPVNPAKYVQEAKK